MPGSKIADIGIVGGGIVGLASALALAEGFPRLRITLLEKESRLAGHQTGHNSGVIHAGIYYKPGTYRARLCVEGARLMKEFCDRNGVLYDCCGKVIVAVTHDELPRLDRLYERGQANGVPGLHMIGPERLRELEPHARALRALYSAETAIVDFAQVAAAMAGRLRAAGVEILTERKVRVIRRLDGAIVLDTGLGAAACRNLINCAGLYSDAVARLAGIRPEAQIIPFRGEYYLLRPERRLVRGLIYPVPDPEFPFLGVHFTKRIQGDYEAGPNAVLAFAREGYRFGLVRPGELAAMVAYRGFRAMVRRYWRTGLREMHRSLSKGAFVSALRRLVPELRVEDVSPGGAGVRAMAVARDGTLVDDFVIAQAPNAIHVLNAPSPAATASLAIGRHIAGLARDAFGLPL